MYTIRMLQILPQSYASLRVRSSECCGGTPFPDAAGVDTVGALQLKAAMTLKAPMTLPALVCTLRHTGLFVAKTFLRNRILGLKGPLPCNRTLMICILCQHSQQSYQ